MPGGVTGKAREGLPMSIDYFKIVAFGMGWTFGAVPFTMIVKDSGLCISCSCG